MLAQTRMIVRPTSANVVPVLLRNTAPRIIILIPPIQITYCEAFQYVIDSDTFIDNEEGNTSNLKVQIEFRNSTKVSDHFWLQWDHRKLTIFGKLNLAANREKLGLFYLSAYDSFGLSARNEIILRLPMNEFTYNHAITMLVYNTPYEVRVKNEIMLASKLSTFWEQKYQIQTIEYRISSRQCSYDFTVCSLKYEPCPSDKLEEIINSLIETDNQPSHKLLSFMLPEIQVMSVEKNYLGPCAAYTVPPLPTTPQISSIHFPTIHQSVASAIPSETPSLVSKEDHTSVQPIPLITVSQCDEFRYLIPENTFIDNIDGNTRKLDLQLLSLTDEALPKSYWLKFDRNKQILYGFVTDIDIRNKQLAQFKLIATNSLGSSKEHIFTMRLPYLKARQYSFSLMFSAKTPTISSYEILRTLAGKLKSYSSSIASVKFIVLKEQANNIYIVRWSDCKTAMEPCMEKHASTLKRTFYVGGDVLRSEFMKYMQPEIIVFQMTFHYESTCLEKEIFPSTQVLQSTYLTPTSITNNPPTVLKPIPKMTVSPCKFFSYQIPEDAFFDVEDGSTRKLHVEILDENMRDLDEDSWLVFNFTSQLLQGVVSIDVMTRKREFTYHIIAKDREGLSTSQLLKIHIDLEGFVAPGQVINIIGVIYNYMIVSRLNLYIYQRLYQFFFPSDPIKGSEKGILIHSTSIYGPLMNNVEIKFSLCGVRCNIYTSVESRIFSSRGTVSLTFAVLMNPQIVITGAKIQGDVKQCFVSSSKSYLSTSETSSAVTNSSPIIFMPIPLLEVGTCEQFRYPIPTNFCYDSQDGFTPNLNLRLANRNFSDVSVDSWIALDKEKQLLSGFLKLSTLQESNNNRLSYLLICSDSTGSSIHQEIHFRIKHTTTEPDYRIQMKSYVYFTEDTSEKDVQQKWINKLKFFLNDNSNSSIHITDFRLSTVLYPQIIITWYDCSIKSICSRTSKHFFNNFFNQRGNFHGNFVQSMVPEFVVISGKLMTNQSCFSSTTMQLMTTSNYHQYNSPPIALEKTIKLVLNPCFKIFYQIPTTVFYDYEDGYSPNLNIKMTTLLNHHVGVDQAIQFNETTQIVHGYFIESEFKEEKKDFLLVAYDSKGMKVTSQLTITKSHSVSYSSHIITIQAALFSLGENHTRVEILDQFSKKLSRYLGDKKTHIRFHYVQQQGKKLEIRWSNCSLINECNLKKLESLKQKLLGKDNEIVVEFIANMAPFFVITDIEFSYLYPCKAETVTSTIMPTPFKNTPPFSNKNDIYVDVILCEAFRYKVPENLFFDREDGNTRNLTLSLKTSTGEKLSQDSWLQYSTSDQAVFGNARVSLLEATKSYKSYTLTATDSGGLSASINLILILPPKPTIGFHVDMTVSRYFEFDTPDLTASLFLTNKICNFMNDTNLNNVLILSFKRYKQNTNFVWTNCSFVTSPCDKVLHFKMKKSFDDKQRLVEVLKPQYILRSLTMETRLSCLSTSISPSFQIISTKTHPIKTSVIDVKTTHLANQPPVATKPIQPIYVGLCESFSYHIAEDAFVDEDGMTSSLDLELLDSFGRSLEKNSWIQFNKELQVAFGVLKMADVMQQPENGYKYILRATDSSGLSSMITLPLKKLVAVPDVSFYYEMSIECTEINSYALVNDLFQLIKKLSYYFGDNNPNTIKVIDLQQMPGRKNVLNFSWTNCTASHSGECPTELIKLTDSLLFDEDRQPNPQLLASFLPQYRIRKVELFRQGKCLTATTSSPVINAPVVMNTLQPIFVEQCDYLSFEIPRSTFYDSQDGDTRNLFLKLTFHNGTMLPNNYWVRVDSEEQRIIGYPIKTTSFLPYSFSLFSLIAVDRDGNEGKTPLPINVIYSSKTLLQNFTLVLNTNFNLMLSDKLMEKMIKNRISRFFGDEDERFLLIYEFQRTKERTLITWSNCTNRGLPCDKALTNQIRNKLITSSGECKPQFALTFLPQFTVEEIKVKTRKECSNLKTSAMIMPSSSTYRYLSSSVAPMPVMFALNNISLQLTDCGDVFYNIPYGIFYDATDGNNHDFQYTLMYDDFVPITCDSWLQYDQLSKSIYGTAVKISNMLPRTFILQARNAKNDIAYTNIFIRNEMVTKEITYKFSISFYTTFSSLCNAELLRILKNKIEVYFKRVGKNELSVIYFSRGSSRSRYYVMFSNCTLSETKCDYHDINYISEMLYAKETYNVSGNFIEALSPEFYSISVLDEKIGACSKVTVLAVGKELDTLCAYSCSEFHYILPKELFVNANNQPAVDLFLEITELDGTKLSENSWIKQNGTRSLFGLVTETVFDNAPEKGYQYLITGYDATGAQTQTAITVKICGTKPTYESSVTLQFQCPETVDSGLEQVIKLLRNFSEYYSDGTLDSVYVIDFKVSNKSLFITWTNCTKGKIELTLEQRKMFSEFSSCRLVNRTVHDKKDYPPEANYEFLRYDFNFCNQNRFPVPNDSFIDREDGSLSNLDLSIAYVNGTRIADDLWVGLQQKSLEFFIMPIKSTKPNWIYEFLLVATDSANQSSNFTIYIEIFSQYPRLNLHGKLTFSLFEYPTAVHIGRFFEKLKDFTEIKLQLIVESFQTYENGMMDLEFGFCLNTYQPCPYRNVTVIENALLDNNYNVNSDFVVYMFPDFVLENMIVERSGPCLVALNKPPQIQNSIGKINVSDCGYLTYPIPHNVFYDELDGWTRNLTLKMFLPNLCSFHFDSTTQTFTALVTREALAIQPEDGYEFILQAIDSKNLSTNLTMKVKLDSFRTSSYEIKILLAVGKPQLMECINENIFILSRLSSFYGDRNGMTLSLRSATKSKDERFIEVSISNCSMRYAPCDYITLNKMINSLELENNSIRINFIEFMQPEYTPRFISDNKDPVCFDINNKQPIVTGKINLPKLFANSCVSYIFDENLATDFEDGSLRNLNVFLINSSTSKAIEKDSWIYLNNSEKILYIAGGENIASGGSYLFTIVFRDSKGASDIFNYELKFERNYRDKNLTKYFLIHQAVHMDNDNSISIFLCNFKSELETKLNMSIRIVDFVKKNDDKLNITWTHEEITCDKARKIVKNIEQYFESVLVEYQLEKLGLCFINSLLTARPNNVLYVNPCKPLFYKIPNEMFQDSRYGNSPNLDIKVSQIYPKSQELKSIKFDEEKQVFLGIITVDVFTEYLYIEFNITATNPLQNQNSTSLKIYLDEMYNKNLEFNLLATFYDQDNSYFNFCQVSFELLSNFFQEDDGVIVFSVSEQSDDKYTINFIPCMIAKMDCQTNKAKNISGILIESGNRPTFKFFSAMKNIIPQSIALTDHTNCTDMPVRIGTTIRNIFLDPCANGSHFKIFNDAFVDLEDGDARNLTIIFENSEKYSWINFDVKEKKFEFYFTLNEIVEQPPDGYKIIIQARDSAGHSVSQDFRIILDSKYALVNHLVELEIAISNYDLQENTKLLKTFKNRLTQFFRLEEYTKFYIYKMILLDEERRFNLTMYNCQISNDRFCKPLKNRKFLQLFLNNNEVKEKLRSFFLPEFYVISVEEKNLNNCSNVSRDVPVMTSEIQSTLPLSFFSQFSYKVPADTVYDRSDGFLHGKSMSLRDKQSNMVKPINYVQFYEDTNEIKAYITQEQRNEIIGNFESFLIEASDSSFNKLMIPVMVQLPNATKNNVIFVTTLKKKINIDSRRLDIICDFVDRLNRYFLQPYNITIVSFGQEMERQDTITIQWTIHEFTGSSTCNESLLTYITGMLKSDKPDTYNPFYIKALGINSGFIHIKTEIRKIGGCQNTPPVSMENITIEVYQCGIIDYVVRRDLFVDKEDGGMEHLNITLRLFRTSTFQQPWIKYSQNKLIGYADERTVSDNQLYLQAKDSGNLTAKSNIFFRFNYTEKEAVSSNISVSTTMECANEYWKMNTLIELLNIQLSFVGLQNDSVQIEEIQQFEKRQTLLRWRPCKNVSFIDLVINSINTTIANCSITAVNFTTEEHYIPKNPIVVEENPIIVNNLPNVIISCGKPSSQVVPRNTFFDFQDTLRLSLEVLTTRYNVINEPFIYFNKSSSSLYFFVSIEDCRKTNIEPIYLIRASDRDGRSVSDSFSVEKIDETVSCCVSIVMSSKRFDAIKSQALFIYDFFVTLKREVYQNHHIVIANIDVKDENITEITLSSKNITNATCYGERIKTFLQPIFQDETEKITDSFKRFIKAFDIVSVQKNYKIQCNETSSMTMITTTASSPPSAGAQTSSMEWFLYLLPLFVLAFVVFAACVFYFSCRYCYRNKGRRNEKFSTLAHEVDFNGAVNDGMESEDETEPITNKSVVSQGYDYNEIPNEVVQVDGKPMLSNKKTWDINRSPIATTKQRTDIKTRDSILPKGYSNDMPSTSRQLNSGALYAKPVRKQKSARTFPEEKLTTSFIEKRRAKKHGLNLPAIPSGPPPPYSPPRRHQIFKQNILPRYYERYSHPQRVLTPVIVPVKQTIIKNPGKTTIFNKRRKLPVLRTSRRYRKKEYEEPMEVSETSSITDTSELSSLSMDPRSESPVEIRALLKGREKSLRKILKRPRTLKLDENTSFQITSANMNRNHHVAGRRSFIKNKRFKYLKRNASPLTFESRKHPHKQNVLRSHLFNMTPKSRKILTRDRKTVPSREHHMSSSSDKSSWKSTYSILKRRKLSKKQKTNLDALLDAIPEEVFEKSFSPKMNARKLRRNNRLGNTTLEEVEDVFSDDP